MYFLLRLVFVCLSSAAAGCWVRILSVRTRPGMLRLVACIPVLVLNYQVQFAFPPRKEFLTRGNVMITTLWAGNFKVLAFCLGRGSLSQRLPFKHFLLTYALPISPQQTEQGTMPRVKSHSRLQQSAGDLRALVRACLGKVALQIGLVLGLSTIGDYLPVLLRELALAFLLYTFLGVLMDINAMIMLKFVHLPVSPHFDKPFLSASVGEFWSHRWNLTIGNTLRTLIYDPIHEGRLLQSTQPYKSSPFRSALAICMAFVVSAIMHWWFFRLLLEDDDGDAWPWFVFFAVQGPLCVVERVLLRLAKQWKILPPTWIRIPFTIVLLLSIAHKYLYPPAIDAGFPETFYKCFFSTFEPFIESRGDSVHVFHQG